MERGTYFNKMTEVIMQTIIIYLMDSLSFFCYARHSNHRERSSLDRGTIYIIFKCGVHSVHLIRSN